MKKQERRKVVSFTPDQLGYKDRGKKKWMGLMLSDHLDAIKTGEKNRIAEETRQVPAKESEEEIAVKLLHALTRRQVVSIQEDILVNGLYKGNIVGLVEGYYDLYVVIETKKGRKKIDRSEIRSVSYVLYDEWLMLDI